MESLLSESCELCGLVDEERVRPYNMISVCEDCVSDIVEHAPGYEDGDDPGPHVETAVAWLDIKRALEEITDKDRRAAIEACAEAGDAAALATAQSLVRDSRIHDRKLKLHGMPNRRTRK